MHSTRVQFFDTMFGIAHRLAIVYACPCNDCSHKNVSENLTPRNGATCNDVPRTSIRSIRIVSDAWKIFEVHSEEIVKILWKALSALNDCVSFTAFTKQDS